MVSVEPCTDCGGRYFRCDDCGKTFSTEADATLVINHDCSKTTAEAVAAGTAGGAVAGTAGGLAVTAAAPAALGAVGFTSTGVAGGSLAATLQGLLYAGATPAGGWFAAATSAAMGGAMGATAITAVAATGGIAIAAGSGYGVYRIVKSIKRKDQNQHKVKGGCPLCSQNRKNNPTQNEGTKKYVEENENPEEWVVLENLTALHGVIIVKYVLDNKEQTIRESSGIFVPLPHRANNIRISFQVGFRDVLKLDRKTFEKTVHTFTFDSPTTRIFRLQGLLFQESIVDVLEKERHEEKPDEWLFLENHTALHGVIIVRYMLDNKDHTISQPSGTFVPLPLRAKNIIISFQIGFRNVMKWNRNTNIWEKTVHTFKYDSSTTRIFRLQGLLFQERIVDVLDKERNSLKDV